MRTYTDTLEYLYSQLPMYQRDGNSAIKKDLQNTLAICEILGNPQNSFRSIHIAGTNGKGSTAHMLASIFQQAGYKTGLYTSPHLKDFRERIKINGEMIAESEVVKFVDSHQILFKDIQPSFFEWTVALAFHHFAIEEVDIAIIETGLGGRLDSTNVIKPILSIITNIAMDHMELLGETLEEIAGEKAGIIKDQTPIVLGNRSGVENIFQSKAAEFNAELIYAEDYPIPQMLIPELRGEHQKENMKTVYTAWNTLRVNYPSLLDVSYPQFVLGVFNTYSNTRLRGRWETLSHSPKVIADVAHNEAGLTYTMDQLNAEKYEKLHIVLGLVKEKDLNKILHLFPKDAMYYFCAAKIPRSLAVEELSKEAHKFNLKGDTYPSVAAAYLAAQQNANSADLIYVGGSNFTVAEVL